MSFVLLGILNSQAAGAAGAGDYDLLETTILGSDASSVSFTGLGAYTDYKHLQIRMVARGDRAGTEAELFLRINNDTGNNYATHSLYGTGSTVSSNSSTSFDKTRPGFISASSETANVYSAHIMDILDFSDANKNTTLRTLNGFWQIRLISGLHINTSAVTEIDIFPESNNFVTGSRFSLYGIKAA